MFKPRAFRNHSNVISYAKLCHQKVHYLQLASKEERERDREKNHLEQFKCSELSISRLKNYFLKNLFYNEKFRNQICESTKVSSNINQI